MKRATLILALTLLLVGVGRAEADTMSFSNSVSLAATNFNDPLVFNQFDPSLETLNSIEVTLAYTFVQSITMTFTTPSTIEVTGEANLVKLERPDTVQIVSSSIPNFTETITYGFAQGQTTFPQTFAFGPTTATGTLSPVTLNSPADLTLFTGTGTVSLPLIASSMSTFVSTSGNGSGAANADAAATVTIEYIFTPSASPTPEPAALTLLGIGTAVMAGYGWRRRKMAAA